MQENKNIHCIKDKNFKNILRKHANICDAYLK